MVGWGVARRGGWARLGDNTCLEHDEHWAKISAEAQLVSSIYKELRCVLAEIFPDRNGSY